MKLGENAHLDEGIPTVCSAGAAAARGAQATASYGGGLLLMLGASSGELGLKLRVGMS